MTTRIVEILRELDWDTVVQTKFPNTALELTGGLGPNFTLVVELTVGLERDWELLEHKKTEHPMDRLKAARRAQREFGLQVGALGEPFIPGYHTIAEFEDAIKLLKEYGINRFNVYNLHFNDLVAKNFAELGLDIEKIWTLNQDKYWRRILRRLLQVADRYGIILGCPDFVNSGWGNVQRCNTCCGVDVKNPCTWNTHYFKLALQQGKNPLDCWDGVGDYDLGMAVIQGTAEGLYTIKDII